MKVLQKKEMTEHDLEMQHNEIEILKVAQHPNIIKLIDVFENTDALYIVLEYMPGGDLFDFQEKRGFKLTDTLSSKLCNMLGCALYYLHQCGIAHRDLKPENIFMSSNGDDAVLKIGDFGLSKVLGPDERVEDSFGTLAYAAPEVFTGSTNGKEVDLWSYGVIAFSLVTGALPFDEEDPEDQVDRILNG